MYSKVKYLFLFIIPFVLLTCHPSDEIITDTGSLNFSETAVVFDTIITDFPTITKRIYVYNQQKKALRISKSYVGGGPQSPYEVFIDGNKGKSFENIILRGGDSLLVLVKAILPRHLDKTVSLAYDSLMFETNGNIQNVKLLSWGQNVKIIKGEVSCNTTWTAEEPYLLMDSTIVKGTCTLTIEEGARVWAYNHASLHVFGKLEAQGKADNRINIRYFRNDKDFGSAYGLWKGIYLHPSSITKFDYVSLKNAMYGLSIEQSTLEGTGNIFHHISLKGLQCKEASIKLDNSLTYHCLKGGVSLEKGTYQFRHCTFVNYQSNNRSANLIVTDGNTLTLQNCIIHGDQNDEITLEGNPTLLFEHNIFKSNSHDVNYFDAYGSNNQVLPQNQSEESLFFKPLQNQFVPSQNSPAIDNGKATSIQKDLKGNKRDASPDIGSYEYLP